MKPQAIVKWVLYIIAIIVFLVPITLGSFDRNVLAFFLLLNAMLWQHEPGGTG